MLSGREKGLLHGANRRRSFGYLKGTYCLYHTGESAVFYDDMQLLGGGVIKSQDLSNNKNTLLKYCIFVCYLIAFQCNLMSIL